MTEPGKSLDVPPDANPPAPADTPARRSPKQRRDGKHIEIGGRKGPEPTRYGDWEKNGRAVDF